MRYGEKVLKSLSEKIYFTYNKMQWKNWKIFKICYTYELHYVLIPLFEEKTAKRWLFLVHCLYNLTLWGTAWQPASAPENSLNTFSGSPDSWDWVRVWLTICTNLYPCYLYSFVTLNCTWYLRVDSTWHLVPTVTLPALTLACRLL